MKAWMGSVTSANGMWSVDISKAGCAAAPLSVQSQAVSTAQTAAGALQSNVSAVSATTVSGTVTAPPTISLGILTVNLFTASATTVFVNAFCQ